MTTLRLPVPPSTNNLFANRRKGGRFPTAHYTRWIQTADAHYMASGRNLARDRVRGPYILTIRIPRDTRGDVSNRIKAVEDWLVSRKLIDDDRNAVRVTAEVAWLCGECEIIIESATAGRIVAEAS